jgi:ribonucleoside-triphosphate reductase
MVCDHRNTEYVADKKVHICNDCGKAFRKPEIYSRVVGYLRPTTMWNKGKKQEFIQRKTYNVKKEKKG